MAGANITMGGQPVVTGVVGYTLEEAQALVAILDSGYWKEVQGKVMDIHIALKLKAKQGIISDGLRKQKLEDSKKTKKKKKKKKE